MSDRPKIVFCCFDVTEYKSLRPIAEMISSDAEVEFLPLGSFLNTSGDSRTSDLSTDVIPYPTQDIKRYIKLSVFKALPVGMSLPRTAVQRFMIDNISPQIAYDVRGYLDEVDPDVFVTAVDQPPFIRHLIREIHNRDCIAATVQHGIYEYALDFEKVERRPFFPKFFDGTLPLTEVLKRRIGFRYGVTQYTHPYLDFVFTMGEFFTDRIAKFRGGYPCFGKTDLVTTGSPEFEGPIEPYDDTVESILFLSQQQYEGGKWGWDRQLELVDRLSALDDEIPVTVRPHPKDSEAKIDHFADHFAVSRGGSLSADIEAHDAVVTIDSTAMFEAVIQGKTCGVLQFPWYPVTFPPFTHEHVVQVDSGSIDIRLRATDRSIETQRAYLDRYCYVTDGHSDPEGTSADLIADILFERVRSGESP